MIRFFEQGSDAIATSASKQNMIQTTKESTEPVPPATPEIPAVPEQPAKEQPKSPKTEIKKDDAGGTKASAKNPKTSDDNTLLCWILLLLLSGSVGSICLVQKNKK